jgi:anti-anti-sigma factor
MGEATYVPGRDVVASAVDAVKAEIKQALEGSAGVFTIDLGGVEMVDSRGLGLLIATANSLNGSQRRLRIIHASADIAELMRMMRLDRHMEIV